MPTREKLESALRNAHKAGDVEAAKKLANALKTQTATPEPEAPAAPEPKRERTIGDRVVGGLEVAGSFLSGLTAEPAAGLAGLVELASDPMDPQAGERAGQRVRDVRESLTYVPQTEAGQEYGQAVGEFVAPVGEAIEKGQRYLGDKAMDATGNPAIAAAAYSAPTAALTLAGYRGGPKPGSVGTLPKPKVGNQIIKSADDLGVPVFTSDVKPPKSFLGKSVQKVGERIPVAGTQSARAAQQGAREAATRNFVGQYADYSYRSIVDSLKSKSSRIKRAAGSTLESTGQKLDIVGPLPADKTRAAIQSAKAKLTRPGAIQSSKAVDNLQELVDALDNQQSFTLLKENRTAFREMVNSADPAIRSQLTSRAKGVLRSVEKAMGEDMDDFARQHLTPKEHSQWQRANQIYADEAKALTKTGLKRVLDAGDATPEAAKNMLFSAKPSEVQQLYTALTPAGRANGRAAIISRVVEDLNKRANGFTPSGFANELKKYENQVGIFFKGKEAKSLEGLRRVLDATKRAQEAGVTTPTGQELWVLLSGGAVATAPVTAIGALGTVGGLARLYESAPVRNALLKLGNAQRGTPAFDTALLQASATLSAAMQSTASGQTAEALQGQ